MLRIFQATSAEAAKEYYTDALSRQDYYVDGQEVGGCWGGKAAEYLGLDLDQDIAQKAFARLCDNLHPVTGERLTPRTRDDRTVGYDLTFHAPKGLSVLHALTGDTRIVEAMQRAVQATMRELEESVHTRVRLGGKSEDRQTGNLIWGTFTHFTTRPVDGVPDPHLHLHAFVFNTTFDQVESRFKAAQFRQLVQRHPYFQAAFHNRLAQEIEAIGYPISRNPEGWDLHGIDRDLVLAYSRRTAEIEAECKRLGITDPSDKDTVGARTRAAKDKDLGLTDLRQVWQHRLPLEHAEWLHRMAQEPGIQDLRQQGLDSSGNADGNVLGNASGNGLEHTSRQVEPLKPATRAKTADEALSHAIAHVYDRKAVESDYRLAAEALKFALTDVTPEQIWAAFDQHPDLLIKTDNGTRYVTTREVLSEETRILDLAVEGRGKHLPLGRGIGGREGTRYQIGRMAEIQGFELNPQQRAAVEQLISSRDKVMLLRGGAGTGKTTLLTEARAAIQHGGSKVFACAITSDASRGVLKDAGFKDACPLEQLLTSKKLHKQMTGQVIWVDEAGMMGTPMARRLFELAEKIDARVVLCGDVKQHAPVERGDAMRLLERTGGLKSAEVTEILRQKGLYKDAVEAVQEGKLAESVKLMDELGAITEIWDPEDPEKRHRLLAEKYVTILDRKQTALVVSPTHAEGQAVTGHIRDRLKEAGRIDPVTERTFTRLKDLQWTPAQRADPHNYKPGMVVQFTQHCPGRNDFKPIAGNTKATILGVDPDKGVITTEDAAGHRRPLPLDLASRFQVFETQDLRLAVGDRIRITRNAHTMGEHAKGRSATMRRVNNGTFYGIKGFTSEGHIKLDNRSGWVLHKNIGHVTHGYCNTPQAVQGKSADVHLGALSGASLAASTLEQVYVMLSRGKKSCELITDSRRSLVEAMTRIDQQRSATELLSGSSDSELTRRKAHAREVQRLRQLGLTRQRMSRDRQRSAEMNRGVHARATQDRDRQAPPQSPGKQRLRGRGRPELGRER